MKPDTINIILRSLRFYKSASFSQVLIIMLLSAVITGSFTTGSSVRYSLRRSSAERLGNTGILITSGVRYFNHSVTGRISQKTGVKSTGILEMNGYSQNFSTGQSAFGVKIIAIDSSFFPFHGNEKLSLNKGEVALNEKLAGHLGLAQGDELIIRFDNVSDIPADAPFAPEKGPGNSIVMKAGKILTPAQNGNFSLSISQITPMNIFINRADIINDAGNVPEINRLLIENRKDISVNDVYAALKEVLTPEDIGLKIRVSDKTGSYEIISDRVFIDQSLIDEIRGVLPSAAPVITYLGNMFNAGGKSTPYSFISGLPSSIYPEMPDNEGLIINEWLAADLNAAVGDTIEILWYSPDIANRLEENGSKFIVRKIIGMEDILSDASLMPEFPGISGSESCSDWDAGVQIDLGLIRPTDEDYWNMYKGTPKAWIGYDKGRELWGSNYGPATSLRFPADMSDSQIRNRLTASFDPFRSGFAISGLSDESVRAAGEGTDFGTLFLSLSFFIILSSVILLILVISAYLDSRKAQIRTFFALGFTGRFIQRMLLLESGVIAFAGSAAGILAGGLFTLLVIRALNSVWAGAVQTDTLVAGLALNPMLAGFLSTFLITLIIILVKVRHFLKNFNKAETGLYKGHSSRTNIVFLVLSFLAALIFFFLSVFNSAGTLSFSFIAGASLFIFLILLSRQIILKRPEITLKSFQRKQLLPDIYYSFYPSHATTPLIFIAAGIFAIFITGANRMDIGDKMLQPSGGTGGFILWSELAVPVREDLNSEAGRLEFGLDDDELAGFSFVQAKKSQGDDASCLNLNNVAAPPLLGIDPGRFIEKGSFSFATRMKGIGDINPWETLYSSPSDNVIYGIADQTVLQWGLKIKTGDTLVIRAEDGQPLSIVIAAGLKASVFQGHIIVGSGAFNRYFPSVSGSQVLLAEGDQEMAESYRDLLDNRFSNYGIHTETGSERLASFYEVTNTYLTVFSFLGSIGMILGIAGLGFVMLRNYSQRKREFALMMATGFTTGRIRRMITREQVQILAAGILTGALSAVVATLPSLRSGSEIPWALLVIMTISIFLAGIISLLIAVGRIKTGSLVTSLRKE